MAEYCGIVPAGARALLAAMNRDRDGLDGLVAAVRGGIGAAGSHVDGAATAADRTLQSYLENLDYWSRELRWRIRYMERLGADGHPIPFANHRQAATLGGAAGTRDGRGLKALWQKYVRSGDDADLRTFREEVERVVGDAGMYRYEASYAGALLRAVGSTDLDEMLARLYRPGLARQADSPTGLRNLPDDLAGLAGLLATADRGGTLPADARRTVVNTDPTVLATVLRAGDFSDAFVHDAARHILTIPGSKNEPATYPEWVAARHLLLDELWRRPGVAQGLLADPDLFRAISDPDLLFTTVDGRPRPDGPGRVDYGYDLAALLWRATGPTVGTPHGRARLWATVIRANLRNDTSPAALSPEIATVLATRVRDYFPYIAYQQTAEVGRNGKMLNGLTPPMRVPMPQPAFPRDVKPGEIGRFLVALARTKEGRAELMNAVRTATQNPATGAVVADGRIAFGPDAARDQQLGLIAALYRGYRTAGLTREEEVEELAGYLSAVVSAPTFGLTRVLKFGVMVAGNLGVNASADALAGRFMRELPNPTIPRMVEAIYRERLRLALKAYAGREPTEEELSAGMAAVSAAIRAAEDNARAEKGKG